MLIVLRKLADRYPWKTPIITVTPPRAPSSNPPFGGDFADLMGSAGLSPRRGFKKTEGESQKPDAVDVKPLIVIGVILRDYRAAGCRGPNGKTVKHATPPLSAGPTPMLRFPGLHSSNLVKICTRGTSGGEKCGGEEEEGGKKDRGIIRRRAELHRPDTCRS